MSMAMTDLVENIAHKHSIDDFYLESNLALQGKSGATHRFDLVLNSRNGEKIRLAVLKEISEDFVKDVVTFNSYAEDCGIELKEVIVDRDLDKPEVELLSAFHITVTDSRSNRSVVTGSPVFGIPDLDRKLGPSITKGNIYMLSGKAGSGKSMLGAQFLISGARIGEKGAVILTDSKRPRFLTSAGHLPEFDQYHKEGMIEVIEISDAVAEMKSTMLSSPRGYGRFILKVAGDIKKGISASNIKRLVIDTITPLIIEDDDFVNRFLDELVMSDTIIFVVSGLRKSNLSFYGIEEYYVSGIIRLSNDLSMPRKVATIMKMRGSHFDRSPSYFRITDEGLVSG
jgi:circadian clock protein KaiC